MPKFLDVTNTESARAAIGATELSVDGTPVTAFDLDTTPLTASDLDVYTRDETDDAIAAGAGGKVCITSLGGGGAGNGANTWTKLASITLNAAFTEAQLLMSVTGARFAKTIVESAIVNVLVTVPGNYSTTPYANIKVLTASGLENTRSFGSDAFKVVGGAAPTALGVNSVYELWMKKKVAFGQFTVFQLGSAMTPSNVTVQYHSAAGWQSAEPTGAVVNSTSVVPTVLTGSGSPENNIAAPVGTLFLRTDGGSGNTLYVKQSGTGATGWAAK